jgi:hypothetical protein
VVTKITFNNLKTIIQYFCSSLCLMNGLGTSHFICEVFTMRHRILTRALPALILLSLGGVFACGGSGGSSTPQVAPPSITSFAAAKPDVTVGDTTTLTAVFTEGVGLVDNGVGAVASGTPVTVKPSATTTYTLTVTNSQGTMVTRTATVTVEPVASIIQFVANPDHVVAGGNVPLAATFTGGKGVIPPGDLPITSGTQVVVTPAATTTYTLTVTNPAGAAVTRTALVTVRSSNVAPVISSMPLTTNGTSNTYQYSISVLDPDGDAVTLSLVKAPAGATLSGNVLQWTIAKDQERQALAFDLQAMDTFGASADQTWTVNATGTITGVRTFTYHPMSGATSVVPADLSAVTLAAWVPDGAGGYTRIPGIGAADGTFSIPGVPGGTYWFQYGTLDFYSTTASTLDLTEDRLGRPDTTPITVDPTNLVLNLTNLAPWQDLDILQWYDPNTSNYSYLNWSFPATSGAPSAGNASLAATTFDLGAPYGGALMLEDTTKGDQPSLTQMGTQTLANGATYQAVTRFFQPSLLVQADGATAGLTGAFTTVPLLNSLLLSLKGSRFAALIAAMHPQAQPFYSGFYLDPNPTGNLGWIGSLPDLVNMDTSANQTTDQDFGILAYGNPFPASWPLIWQQYYTMRVPYTLSGMTGTRYQSGNLIVTSTVMSAAASIQPVLSPVSQVMVGGKPVSTAPATGAGLAPTISWLKPNLGTPAYYRLTLYRLYNPGSGTATPAIQTVGYYTTAGTSMTLPAGVLTAGETYFVKIAAFTGSNKELSPFKNTPSDWALADCLTFTFQP